jgi:hypothetical protein
MNTMSTPAMAISARDSGSSNTRSLPGIEGVSRAT